MVENDSAILNDQNVEILSYDFNGFEPLLHKKDDTLRIINFWAT